ncbi:hypothetical protein GCM10010218_62930 [Streptomyces mashuensis]|uniref:Uncharacterized protein n=1 Tax=Streptomyces mashuensis TaxID=33904 RepID=A0A919EG96_9ACTN|nr:hypothetical protein [Streptomyces mashuensis]GHF73134.1 hypothetical protein GCM10010218_62930 [Streptomyces mashuensis]
MPRTSPVTWSCAVALLTFLLMLVLGDHQYPAWVTALACASMAMAAGAQTHVLLADRRERH